MTANFNKEADDVEAVSAPSSLLPPPPPRVYAPTCPDNAPAVLTFSNLTVTTKRGGSFTMTKKKKQLLNNISGSISGGLWAIMGEYVSRRQEYDSGE